MKEYLLKSNKRLVIVEEAGGKVCTAAGTKGLGGLLTDRSFACLHYVYSPGGRLEACQASVPDTEKSRHVFCCTHVRFIIKLPNFSFVLKAGDISFGVLVTSCIHISYILLKHSCLIKISQGPR